MDFYQTVREEYLRCKAICQTVRRYAKAPLTGHISIRRNKGGTVRYYRVFRDLKTGCRKTERIEDLAMVNALNRKNLCLRWQRTAEKNMELLEPVLSHFTRIDPSILAAEVTLNSDKPSVVGSTTGLVTTVPSGPSTVMV